MRIDGPQVTSSLSLNGTTITDLNIFVTTGSLNTITGSYATTGSNLFNGTQTLSGSIIPAVNNTYDLGSPTHQFRHVYISSGSLYVNGTKVLGSTAQELQITTDLGQSFKVLESGADTITLQSNDGNVTLTSTGGGDIIMDPNTGVIGLKGTVTIYTGNKIVSSDGNAIQFGNGIAITGSIVATGTSLISGSSQVLNGSGIWSGSAQLPSGVISGSAQLPSGIVSSSTQVTAYGFSTTGSNNFVGTQTITGSLYISQNLVVQGSSSLQDVTGSNVYIGTNKINLNTNTPAIRFGGISVQDSGSNPGLSGSLFWDSLNNNWLYQHPNVGPEAGMSAMLISGPKNSGSLGDEVHITPGKIMVANGDDHIGDSIITQTGNGIGISGDLSITGSIVATGTSLWSGSAQLPSGVISGSAQLPSGIVSSSAQTIANLPSGVVSGSAQTIANLPSGTVSGSVQVDVMSTTNIARLATTGSNVFTGALSGTSATFSSSVTATNMNVFGTTELAYVNGTTQMRISRSGTLARLQNYENGSVSNISLNWEGGNVGVGVTDPSTALDVYKIGSGGALTGAAMTLRSGNASSTSGSQQILFSYSGTTLYRHSIRTRHMSDAAAGNAIDFYTWKYGTDTNSTIGTQHVMTIDGNARVGIQSTTPEAPLHIGGSTNYITFANNINNAHTDIRFKATNKGEAVIWKAADTFTSYGGAGSLNIYNSSDLIAFHPSATSNVAVITSTGIGIGNVNPKFYLHSNDDVTIPNNRYLNFTSEINAANFNKSLVVSYTDNSATSQPNQIGIILHNNSNTDNTFSPALVFGNKSNSLNYSQASAAIAAKRLTFQQDANWHSGELYFWTATSGGSSINQGIPADAPAMILDSRRRMRVPSQPSFQVHRGSTANFEITNSSDTNVLPFNTVRHDTAGNYNTSTYRFTAPIAGRYFFSATVRWDSSSAGSYLRTFFTVNGSSGQGGSAFNYGHQIKGPSGYSSNYQSLTVSAVIQLAAGDYVSVVGGINSGTTNMHQESQFSGYMLG